MVSTRRDRGLSVDERHAKPAGAKDALVAALKASPADPEKWAASLESALRGAFWYAVDLEQAVGEAFQEMTSPDLKAIEKACQSDKGLDKRLAWIAGKINERQAAEPILKDKLKHAIEKSMAFSMNGFSMGAARQKILWSEINTIFDSSFGFNLENMVRDALRGASISRLLHFAKPPVDGKSTDSTVLSAVRTQAFSQLKTNTSVPGDTLSDEELGMLSKLARHADVMHLANCCATETEKREKNKKRNQLASYFDARLSKLAETSGPDYPVKRSLSVGLPYPELTDAEVTEIVASVIAKAAPATVLNISRLVSTSSRDQPLIAAAREQLKSPDVKALSHTCLLGYLKLPEDSIPTGARESLEEEAKERAEQARATGMEVLKEGLESDSYRRLVGAVLEFATLDKLKSDFREAADIDVDPAAEKMPDYFLELDQCKILDLKYVAAQLKSDGQVQTARQLSSFISRLKSIPFVSASSWEEQRIIEAVSHFFPQNAAGISRLELAAVNAEVREKYFSELFKTHYDEDLQKRIKTDAGDFPVCIQFKKDQRTRCVRIESTLVDGYSTSTKPSDVDRTHEFITKMRGEKFNDAQIMMASRIACQNSANVLVSLIASQKICALTDAERKYADDAVGRIGNAGLIPARLESDANITRNGDGSMTVDVQIFQDNTRKWFGIDPNDRIFTDPQTSLFSSRLKFVVDEKGEILEDDATFEMAYCREITQSGPGDE